MGGLYNCYSINHGNTVCHYLFNLDIMRALGSNPGRLLRYRSRPTSDLCLLIARVSNSLRFRICVKSLCIGATRMRVEKYSSSTRLRASSEPQRTMPGRHPPTRGNSMSVKSPTHSRRCLPGPFSFAAFTTASLIENFVPYAALQVIIKYRSLARDDIGFAPRDLFNCTLVDTSAPTSRNRLDLPSTALPRISLGFTGSDLT